MTTIPGGIAFTAADASALVLQGHDSVWLWAAGEVVAAGPVNAGSNSLVGGNGAYGLTLTGGHDTVSLGNGNDTIIAGAPVLEPIDQQILVGGLQGFADLADPSNTVSLIATGRASEYLHWAALVDAATGKDEVAGAEATRAQITAMQGVFAHSSGPLAELDYNADPQGYFSGLFASDFGALGFHPTNANVNMFALWQSASGVAAWDAYVNQARAHGMQSVAPIYSPNDLPQPVSWADPMFAPIRAMALYGGAIGIDAPPSFFFAQGASYQQFIVDEIKWGVANGLRVSVIVSPYAGNSTYLADTGTFVKALVAAGAVPTQWVAENYDVPVPAGYPNYLGSEDQTNTVDNIALWLARNAPTVAQGLSSDNVITVGNGNDRIALAAYDVLHAGSGVDTIGSGGNAVIAVAGGSGTLTLGFGDAASVAAGHYGVVLGSGDSLTAVSGSVTVRGGSGFDTVSVGTGFASIVGGAAALSVAGGAAILSAALGSGGGVLQGGTGGANWLAAAAGAATILGGAAGDTITGGSGGVAISTALAGGADVVLGTGAAMVTLHAGDTLYGGAGASTVSALSNDTIYYGSGLLSSAFGTGDCISAGGAANRNVVVATGNNTISGVGGTGTAVFTGGSGFDVLRAGNGNDVLSLGSGGGQEWAGAGNATLNGGGGSVTMTGGSGATVFNGQQANIDIVAGIGTGVITTGTGTALVQLQTGADTVSLGSGAVTVLDGTGIDMIDLTGAAGTHDVVRGFKLGVDALALHGGVSVSSEQYIGGAAVLRLSDGAVVSIYGGFLGTGSLPVVFRS